MFTLATPSAIAQDADPAAALTNGVRCSEAYARRDIEENLRTLATPPDAVLAALNLVAIDAERCAPVRNAAGELAADPALPQLVGAYATAAASSTSATRTLAEAPAGPGELKFEVGPPPRNLTNGRSEGH